MNDKVFNTLIIISLSSHFLTVVQHKEMCSDPEKKFWHSRVIHLYERINKIQTLLQKNTYYQACCSKPPKRPCFLVSTYHKAHYIVALTSKQISVYIR